jgi:tRNA threonylcarbamoyl adenosine modification protein YjeE
MHDQTVSSGSEALLDSAVTHQQDVIADDHFSHQNISQQTAALLRQTRAPLSYQNWSTHVALTQLLMDENATNRLAEDIAMVLKPGDCLTLQGDLGTGKTTFVRAAVRALMDQGTLEVQSPTYTLSQTYEMDRFAITHLDLYRLEHPDELRELGLEDTLDNGVTLIEWPERAGPDAFPDALHLKFYHSGKTGRKVEIILPKQDKDDWSKRLARTLKARSFIIKNGKARATRRFMQGDASTRTYERIRHNRQSAILMNAPAKQENTETKEPSYSQLTHLAANVEPFIAVTDVLSKAGFSAPVILGSDIKSGFLLVEDLGQHTLLEDGEPVKERYVTAVHALSEMHQKSWPTILTPNNAIRYTLPNYDLGAFLTEADLLLDWYAPFTGTELDEDQRESFTTVLTPLMKKLLNSEQSLVLRDYHSPNCLWLEDRQGTKRIGMIDVQDAVIGPSAYDVASLAQDARVDISHEMEAALLDAYEGDRSAHDTMAGSFDRVSFDEAYALAASQRALKVLGIFARLSMRDDKHHYLHHLPRVRDYLNRNMSHPVLGPLHDWLLNNLPKALPQGIGLYVARICS